MFQFRWQVASGKTEDFPFDDADMESFNIIFRYSKGLPRDAIKVGDELLKFLVGKGERKAKPADVEIVARNTLKKGKFKTQETENKQRKAAEWHSAACSPRRGEEPSSETSSWL